MKTNLPTMLTESFPQYHASGWACGTELSAIGIHVTLIPTGIVRIYSAKHEVYVAENDFNRDMEAMYLSDTPSVNAERYLCAVLAIGHRNQDIVRHLLGR